jgi:APA family basic amino acid/polyamine antiporter
MLIALAGSANACVLAAPRIYFAQARDGLPWRWLGHVHPKFRTPSNALLLQAAWSIALAVTGSYETLLGFCTFGAWIFYAMVVAGLIRLRRVRPEAPRLYRMWGYPWTPGLFILIALAFVLSALINQPLPSIAGLALILLAVPFYFWQKRLKRP